MYYCLKGSDNIFNFLKKKQEIRAEPTGFADISDFKSIFSGQTITRSHAMEIPTVSACVNKIAETISRLPVKLYRKGTNRITEITDDSRILLLNGETGDTLNTVDMWKSAIEDYFLGNGAWIYLNSDGIRLKSIHYVDSRNISVMANSDPIFKAFDIMVNGRKYYDFQFLRLFRKT
ncbi:MAG: phage portal protein, partial [Ruminococcus sp.]|nr:phage portal protein [Ruminococcus sp.]